ncbi:hypothetical protein ATL39_0553 [Sinobaca qinghaiensis]|uniref:5,10-methylene-tetrahydrofolate dehydrogenase n=1 Tax=Sinobaca qinghaiensis TaxID=342944 RepID=A0A419V8F5_9BACL|nr:hypothetical protein [Sinobaca qinghaiensis]RKD76337.1 hypothetical protein ATL39_0553 [Sinobaca qinghaiensis]
MDNNSRTVKEQDPTGDTVSIGLIASPEMASSIAQAIEPDFPFFLELYVEDNVSWKVEVVTDAFAGSAEKASDIMKEAEAVKEAHGWDYAVCLTDLPFFREGNFLVAEVNGKRKISQLSIPALGAVPMKKRVREASLQLISEMYHGSSKEVRDREQEKMDRIQRRNEQHIPKKNARDLVRKGWFERMAPIDRAQPKESSSESDVRFMARAKWNGYVRLITGMIQANNPWTIFSAFKNVIALAFASGAYAMIFPTLWQLGEAYDWQRSLLLMAASFTALTSWIIISHGLWERRSKTESATMVKLHNTTTILTLSMGVLGYYVVLFCLFFFAVFLFIPVSLLESSTGLDREVGFAYYLSLTWLVTSLATCIGALGAGLEDEEAVLNGTYGYRQRQRKKQAKKEQEQKEYEGKT